MDQDSVLPSFDKQVSGLIVWDESKLILELHKALKKYIDASVYISVDTDDIQACDRVLHIRISKMNVYWEHKLQLTDICEYKPNIYEIAERIAWGMKQQVLDTFFYSLPPEYNIKQQREMR